MPRFVKPLRSRELYADDLLVETSSDCQSFVNGHFVAAQESMINLKAVSWRTLVWL